MFDEHNELIAELQETIERQRALLDLAFEVLEGLGFTLDEFAEATS